MEGWVLLGKNEKMFIFLDVVLFLILKDGWKE